MNRFKKSLTFDIVEGEVSDRLTQVLENVRGRGEGMSLLRDWLFTGFVMSEMGDGIVEYIRAQDRNPATRQMTKKEKMEAILRFIERCQFDHDQVPPPKPPPPAVDSKPPVSKPRPDKKTRITHFD